MRNAFRIFRRDLKRILRNPAALLVIIGVSIIPSLYAWFNIVANIDPYANTSGIKVAVANNDQEASSNGLSINAGDEIITNLKEMISWDGPLCRKMKPLKASDPASIMQQLLFRTISVNHC